MVSCLITLIRAQQIQLAHTQPHVWLICYVTAVLSMFVCSLGGKVGEFFLNNAWGKCFATISVWWSFTMGLQPLLEIIAHKGLHLYCFPVWPCNVLTSELTSFNTFPYTLPTPRPHPSTTFISLRIEPQPFSTQANLD